MGCPNPGAAIPGAVIESAWRRGARFDSWSDQFRPALWWLALEDEEIDVHRVLHSPALPHDRLPWDHIGVRQGRAYLEREGMKVKRCESKDEG